MENYNWKERYKNLPYKKRWLVDRSVKKYKRRKEAIKKARRAMWFMLTVFALIGVFISVATIEADPATNGTIMIGCISFLFCAAKLEEIRSKEARNSAEIIRFSGEKDEITMIS